MDPAITHEKDFISKSYHYEFPAKSNLQKTHETVDAILLIGDISRVIFNEIKIIKGGACIKK